MPLYPTILLKEDKGQAPATNKTLPRSPVQRHTTANTSFPLQGPWWFQPTSRWLKHQDWELQGHSIYKPQGITRKRCHHTTVRYNSEQESDRTPDTMKIPTKTSATRKIHTMTPNIRNTQAKTPATNKTPPRTSAPIINLPHKETWWLQPTGRWLNNQGWEQQSHSI